MSVRSARQGNRAARVAGKGAFTVQTINIISQSQYFVACCLISYISYASVVYMYLFSFYPETSDVGEMHSLALAAVPQNLSTGIEANFRKLIYNIPFCVWHDEDSNLSVPGCPGCL
jgi:hypothetical protein